MKKWIYKITNNINGKIYIGQSVSPARRFNSHISGAFNSAIHNAIKKYGEENFSFDIIEGPIQNYNEREIYWIKFYDSYNTGYNRTIGGEYSIGGVKFEEGIINGIKLCLLNTDLDYKSISEIYGVSEEYISAINRGVTRVSPGLTYPIREHNNSNKSKDLVRCIVDELMNTTKSVEQMARDFGVDSLTIYRINLGYTRRCPVDVEYPIRDKGKRISRKMLSNIIADLLDNKLMFSEIEHKYHLSKSAINRINQGKKYKQDNLDYPIRPSSKRVHK